MVVSSYSTHSFYAFICTRYVHLIPIRYPFLYSDQDVNCSGNEFGSDGGFCVRGNANDIADECNNNGDCDNGECLVLSYVLDFIRILYVRILNKPSFLLSYIHCIHTLPSPPFPR